MDLLVHPLGNMQLERIARTGGGSILIHGPAGVGKRTAALEVARRLNCHGCDDASCAGCKQATAGNHPNIMVVAPDEKGKIGIEAVHALQHGLTYREYQSEGQRVVIIAQSHYLTIPAQHALLKVLEEPPAGTTMILTATSPSGLLDTIVSRCRPVHMAAIHASQIQPFLERQGLTDAAEAARLSHGTPGLAVRLASDQALLHEYQVIDALLRQLTDGSDLYERLKAAATIAKDNARQSAYKERLHTIVRQTTSQDRLSQRLAAVERLRLRLGSNVNPRVSFEAYAVEAAW